MLSDAGLKLVKHEVRTCEEMKCAKRFKEQVFIKVVFISLDTSATLVL